MTATERLGLAALVAVALAALSLSPITQDDGYYWPGVGLAAVVYAVGALARRLRFPGWLRVIFQGAGLAWAWAWQAMPVGPSDWPQKLLWVATQSAERIEHETAPLAPDPAVRLLLVALVALVAVVVEAWGVVLQRPVWTFPALLVPYLVPAIAVRGDLTLRDFLPVALACLVMLLVSGLVANRSWPTRLESDSAEGSWPSRMIWTSGAAVGIPALAAALVLGLLVPPLSPMVWSSGGFGNLGPLQMTDPSLDLRRNLRLPDDRVVLTYRSNQPGGSYLRLATLPKFDRNGWQLAPIRVVFGDLPAVPGLADGLRTVRETDVNISGFSSQWLPVPYAPRAVRADGSWGVDANSLDLVGRQPQTNGLSYHVTSWDVEPEADALRRARVGVPTDADLTTQVPEDLPDSVRQLADTITRGASSPAARAAAIQAYLRSSRFTYSLAAQPGSGYQALVNFLTLDRTGYCEQFAAAMAILARIEGIPARVAIGFLPGRSTGDHYEVSSRNMHSWPELFFDQLGWVRFEPTPASVTGQPPPWSLPEQRPTASARTTATSSAGPETVAPTRSERERPDPGGGGTAQQTDYTPAVLGLVGGFVAVLAVASPMAIRRLRRRRRLGAHSDPAERIENAWAELRDSVIDIGQEWPKGSPRQVAESLGGRIGNEAALRELAGLVERSRYAASLPETVPPLGGLVIGLTRGLRDSRGWSSRLRGLVWPPSVWTGRGRRGA